MKRPFTADSMWTYYNGTLKNKFEIKDYKKLDKKENEIIKEKLKNLKLKSFTKEH